jgi:hypothetical protein
MTQGEEMRNQMLFAFDAKEDRVLRYLRYLLYERILRFMCYVVTSTTQQECHGVYGIAHAHSYSISQIHSEPAGTSSPPRQAGLGLHREGLSC